MWTEGFLPSCGQVAGDSRTTGWEPGCLLLQGCARGIPCKLHCSALRPPAQLWAGAVQGSLLPLLSTGAQESPVLLDMLSHSAGCCSSCCLWLGSAPHRCHLEEDSTGAMGLLPNAAGVAFTPLPIPSDPVTLAGRERENLLAAELPMEPGGRWPLQADR